MLSFTRSHGRHSENKGLKISKKFLDVFLPDTCSRILIRPEEARSQGTTPIHVAFNLVLLYSRRFRQDVWNVLTGCKMQPGAFALRLDSLAIRYALLWKGILIIFRKLQIKILCSSTILLAMFNWLPFSSAKKSINSFIKVAAILKAANFPATCHFNRNISSLVCRTRRVTGSVYKFFTNVAFQRETPGWT